MAALSDYAENLVLNWLMRGEGETTHPTSWHIGLFSAAPNDTGGGTEISGSGYARQACTWASASGTGGTTSNEAVETFTASGGAWLEVTHIGIFDASSSGNLLWHGALTSPKTAADGDSLQFAIGAIDLTLA